jgi:ribosomal protein S6--L-glutamate ligase
MNILHLSTAKPSKHFIKACTDLGNTYKHYHPEDLYFEVSDSTNGYDRIYNGNSELEKPERIHVKDFDGILTRIGSNVEYSSRILRHLNINLGIYSTQSAYGILIARDKMSCTQILSSHGLKVPRTVMAYRPNHPEFLVQKVGGLPCVGKLLTGSQGVGVLKFESASQTNDTLESFAKSNISLLLQSYVEGKASDYRAIVVGNQVVSTMKRTAISGFKANITRGGKGEKVTLSQADQDICVKAAKACQLETAGVDIMKSASGETFVIEVNTNFGSKVIDITGHNFFVDIVKHMEANYKKKTAEFSGPKASVSLPGPVAQTPALNWHQRMMLDPLNQQIKKDLENWDNN